MNSSIRLKSVFAVICLLGGCATTLPERKEQAFFVEDASPVLPSCSDIDGREAAVACNRIAKGSSLVVGVREYSSNGVDTERFLKVTLFLDGDLSEGEVLHVPSAGVRMVFGSGLSFMPGKSGCYGEAKSGTISVVDRNAEQLELDVDAVFELKSPLSWSDACKEYVFKKRILAKRLFFEELGAWEGVAGADDSMVAESTPKRPQR